MLLMLRFTSRQKDANLNKINNTFITAIIYNKRKKHILLQSYLGLLSLIMHDAVSFPGISAYKMII